MPQTIDERARELRRQTLGPSGAIAIAAMAAWLLLGRGFWSVMLTLIAIGGLLLSLMIPLIMRRQERAEAAWKRKARPEVQSRDSLFDPSSRPPRYGQFGEYQIDPHDDPWYGMFIEISGRPVFLDLRSDQKLEERKAFARRIESNAAVLAGRFDSFVSAARQLQNHVDEGVRILHIAIGADADRPFGEVTILIGEADDCWTCLLTEDLGFCDLQYSS